MPTARTALVVGASRGLGLVLAGELARRGWHVIATTRRKSAELQQVADAANGQMRIVRHILRERAAVQPPHPRPTVLQDPK